MKVFQEIRLKSFTVDLHVNSSNVLFLNSDEASAMQLLFGASFDTTPTPRTNTHQQNIDLVKEQFKNYLNEPIDIDKNPLVWWETNHLKYNAIAPLAKRALCVMGTSVPSERLFSAAGNLVTAKRSCLSSKNIDIMLFLNKNLD